MLIAAISILSSIVFWAIKSLANGSETHYQSVNDSLPRYRK